MEYLDLLAENAQNWDTTGSYEAPGKTQPHKSVKPMNIQPMIVQLCLLLRNVSMCPCFK